ncbi:MAG: DUF1735 domain-containing protein [Salinivirgaceae bacterium]|nr:DUF1735 domain-containing protein [Salinivirgaceae bacterium]
MNRIVSILSVGAVALAFASCKNSEQNFPDFDGGTTAYFSYQYPIRTLILGNVETYDNTSDNEHRFTIYGTFGGSYEGVNAKIDVEVDESLTQNLYFEDGSEVKAMPKDYYEIKGEELDYGGGFRGGVEIQLTEKFFEDPLAVKNTYVIPVVMGDNFSGVDRINRGTPIIEGTSPLRQDASKWDESPKDYTLFCVNYINEYTSTYLRRGTDNFDKLKFKEVTETVTGDDMCIAIHAGPKKEQVWDNQFWIDAVTPFVENDVFTLTMDVKATKEAKSGTQIHEGPGAYKANLGEITFPTEWKTVTITGTITSGQAGGHSIAFNLSELADSNDYYIDNVSFMLNNVEMMTNGRCDDVASANYYTKERHTSSEGATVPSTFESTGKKQTVTNVYQVPDGYEKVTESRHAKFIESDEVVYTTSKSRNQVILPIATTEVAGVPTTCELVLTFDGYNCTITSNNETLYKASGTGKYVKDGAPLAWGNKDRDVLYLDYTVDFKQDDVHYATQDTLVWRDRGSVAAIQTYKPVYKED